ncbi:MAG: peroxide stress protein YaaA [Mariprofundaceae bacterium]|nr:peroxide stress protein YaaA [Mariprofundaceae bacterium]
MLIVISPAKKLDFTGPLRAPACTQPAFLAQSQILIDVLRQKDSDEIATLMHLSAKLAGLNTERFQQWHTPFSPDNARPAIFAFKGDVYQGLDAGTLKDDDIDFAQKHLRILSGLYGLLRPLDLIQPYRLEMGTQLAVGEASNLYRFWGTVITHGVNDALQEQGDDILINLASGEYFKAIRPGQLHGRIITPVFRERKGDAYKVIGIHAKRARGMMSRFIIKHRLTEPGAVRDFSADGYAFNAALSDNDTWVFTRG